MTEQPPDPNDWNGEAIPGARLVRDWIRIGLAAAPAVIALAGAVAGATFAHPGWMLLGPLALVTVAALAPALARRRALAGVLTLDADWLSWSGERWLRRADLREATWRDNAERGAIVHLGTKHREVWLALLEIETAQRLLGRLGLGASQRVARFRVESRMFDLAGLRRAVFVVLALSVPLGGGMSVARVPHLGWVFLALLCMLVTFVLAHHIPTRVVVGADALTLTWLGRVEIVPFSQVRDVLAHDAQEGTRNYVGLTILKVDGSSLRILTGPKDRDEPQRDRLLERIRDVLALHRGGDRALDASALLRGGRPADEWIRALRAAGAGADADMRHASIPVERLWRLLHDVGAEGLARAAAAVALAPSASPEERARIRVAAESSASPALRIALERSIDEQADDEALAESLYALEQTTRR